MILFKKLFRTPGEWAHRERWVHGIASSSFISAECDGLERCNENSWSIHLANGGGANDGRKTMVKHTNMIADGG